MQSSIGTGLIIIGAVLIAIGLVAKSGVISWFGHLPGDFHIKTENFQFFFPLASMIVVSIILSLLIALLRKLL
jgi:energy-converting hydrogenase Eha subunit H